MMRTIKYITLAALFVLYSFILNGQNKTINSLKNVLQTQNDDVSKVNTLNELSWKLLMKSDISNAMNFANTALKLAEKIDFKKGCGTAYYNIGSIYHTQNNIPEAIRNYSIALKIRREVGDEKGIAESYLSFGQIYLYSQNNEVEAVRNFSNAIAIQEEIGDKKGLGESYLNFGGIYTMQENDHKALEYFYKSLKVYEEIKDNEGIAAALGKMGMVYSNNNLNDEEGLRILTRALELQEEIEDAEAVAFSNLGIGDILSRQNKLPEALQHQLKALEIYQNKGDTTPHWSIPYCLERIGNTYELQGDSANLQGNRIYASDRFSLAKRNYVKAAELREINKDQGVAYSLLKLGGIYIKLDSFSIARKMLERSLIRGKQINFKSVLSEVFRFLSSLDSVNGNYESAYINYRNYILYKDSLENDRDIKNVTQMRMQYEFDKKETVSKAEQVKKNAEIERKRNLQYTASGVILLSAIFLYWNNRQKQKAKTKIEKSYIELKATQQQLIQSEKMASLGELTAGIAHEIQNPLNFVNNFSEVNQELVDELLQELKAGRIYDAISISNNIKENEERINHHGKRADAIVKGMLQHSQAGTGVKEPTDINVLAGEYLRLSYHGFRAKNKDFNATMNTYFDESLPTGEAGICKINIIPQDIGKVLLNVYNNAFYAVNERKKQSQDSFEPTISVTTKKLENKIIISVKDNGNGIPQKVVDKIFQPFFTTKPTGQGTGLGLSLSYDIIKAHGGEIKVKTVDGEGAEFVIILPLNS